MNYENMAAELLRALRGKRSRPRFSRYLGYQSNIAQRWETRECWPTASRFFQICQRVQIDVKAALEAFFQRKPSWLASAELGSMSGVGQFLNELRGRTPIKMLAERASYNRYSVARWLKGTADPKLPELLCLVDACSRRLVDFLATLVDPEKLPSVGERFRKLEIARKAAAEQPLSHAVFRALELTEYHASGYRDPEYLMRKIGATPQEIAGAVNVLIASGQVKKTRHGFRAEALPMVDTGGDPKRSRALKCSWTKLALERMQNGSPGNFGYSVFAIGKRDLTRLREIHLAFVREMQALIANSTDTDCVALYCAQLLDLAVADDNAFALKAE